VTAPVDVRSRCRRPRTMIGPGPFPCAPRQDSNLLHPLQEFILGCVRAAALLLQGPRQSPCYRQGPYAYGAVAVIFCRQYPLDCSLVGLRCFSVIPCSPPA
jgi:hypothetical protein